MSRGDTAMAVEAARQRQLAHEARQEVERLKGVIRDAVHELETGSVLVLGVARQLREAIGEAKSHAA